MVWLIGLTWLTNSSFLSVILYIYAHCTHYLLFYDTLSHRRIRDLKANDMQTWEVSIVIQIPIEAKQGYYVLGDEGY